MRRRLRVRSLAVALALSIGNAGIWPPGILADETYLSMDDSQSSMAQSPSASSPSQQSAPLREISGEGATSAVAPQACLACERADESKKDESKKKEELQTAMNNAYKEVFYANAFSYLNDPLFDGPFFIGDSLKGLRDGKLDVGGEFRSRFHHENNMRGLGLTGVDDEFWLSRMRLFTNYRMSENIRFYGEYLYADSGGENFAPRPIEENRGEAQNLFFDVKLLDSGDSSVSARLGRQELIFGAQRLISPLDWANTRRTFDGYRLTYASSGADLDLFYTNPVARVAATGGRNEWDSSDDNQQFYGAYLSAKGLAIGAVETYYLGYDNEGANFSYHTLGSRLAGTGDIFLYELEGGVQFGDNADSSDHGAAFFTAGLGRKMDLQLGDKDWTPTIWGWYDWASGGDPGFVATGDDSFHHYFPLAHKYNGFMDLFGRRNLNDVNMQLITPLGSKVSALLWYHYFFLDKATTPYSVVMTPFNAANTAGSKDLGHEIDLLLTMKLNARNDVLLGYSYFGAGAYYDTTVGVPTNADADFFYFQYQSRF